MIYIKYNISYTKYGKSRANCTFVQPTVNNIIKSNNQNNHL